MKADEGIPREELYERGIFPAIFERSEKFPGGESADEVKVRCERVAEELVMPHVWKAAETGRKEHMAVVSHGLYISELVATLVQKDGDFQFDVRGMKNIKTKNTAWTRLTIDIPVSIR